MTKFTKCEKLECLKRLMAPKKLVASLPLNHKSYGILMLALILVCGILYLSQINSLATKGYKINELENNVKRLESVNKKLQVQVTEMRSMANLETRLTQLNMVPVGHVEYIKVIDSSVAVNR